MQQLCLTAKAGEHASVVRCLLSLLQTQLSKLLALKQQRVQRLTDMNTEVEKMVRDTHYKVYSVAQCLLRDCYSNALVLCQHARQKPLPVDFQRQYATVIIELDDINKVRVSYLASFPVRSAMRKSIMCSICNLQLHFDYSGGLSSLCMWKA